MDQKKLFMQKNLKIVPVNLHFSSAQAASGSKLLAMSYSELCLLPNTEEDGAFWAELW